MTLLKRYAKIYQGNLIVLFENITRNLDICKVKLLLPIAIVAIFPLNLIAQRAHIKQSKPFEKVLISMKSDSTNLFMNSFSDRIIDGEDDKNVWLSRLIEGKEKFKERFGTFQPSDFTYKFNKKDSQLIIFFKDEEQIRLRVTKEGGMWKLDEK
jgi:hypothetical protein